jgi:hypothetical protein
MPAMNEKKKSKRQMAEEALQKCGPQASDDEIRQWLSEVYPGVQVSKSTIWGVRPALQRVPNPFQNEMSMADLQQGAGPQIQ